MVPREMHMQGHRVVQVRECDAILCPHRLSDYDLVDVVKLIPIFIPVAKTQKQKSNQHTHTSPHTHLTST